VDWRGAARCRPQGVTNENQIPITEFYEIPGGCVTVTGLGLKDAAEEKGPIPLGAPRPRNAHEGFWNELNPAGYKLVRRAPHACKGLALDRNETIAHENANP
jgi:hypothetical protein